ncbi:MAG: hypothetical protein CMO05_10895 [Thalassospira sp.]|nr:hypothetical protein [Thalassospira sp.]
MCDPTCAFACGDGGLVWAACIGIECFGRDKRGAHGACWSAFAVCCADFAATIRLSDPEL